MSQGNLPAVLPATEFMPTGQNQPAGLSEASYLMYLMAQPIPRPGYLPDDWMPDLEELAKPTPKKYRLVQRNNDGTIRYYYAPIGFYLERANRAFHYQWNATVIKEGWGEPEERSGKNGKFTRTPYKVEILFVVPCMWPKKGVGISYMNSNNPDDNEVKTMAGAMSAAIKNAMKQFGVGRDVEPDDPDLAQQLDGQRKSVEMVWDRLVANEAIREQAQAVAAQLVPGAMLANGSLMIGQIDEDDLDRLQKELTGLAVKSAAAARNGKAATAT